MDFISPKVCLTSISPANLCQYKHWSKIYPKPDKLWQNLNTKPQQTLALAKQGYDKHSTKINPKQDKHLTLTNRVGEKHMFL